MAYRALHADPGEPRAMIVWAAVLATFVFWAEAAMGAVAFAALLQVTGAVWSEPFRPYAERFRIAVLVSCLACPLLLRVTPKWSVGRSAIVLLVVFASASWFAR